MDRISKRVAATLAAVATLSSIGVRDLRSAPTRTDAPKLEDLGDGLLDDAVLEGLMKQAGKAQPAGEAQPPLLPDVDKLRRMLDPQQPSPGEDVGQAGESPLSRISTQMAQARSLIAEKDITGETREVQEEIVSQLDELIDKLNKQCQNCSGGQCNKPSSQQTQKSTPKLGGKPSASAGSQASPQQSQVSSGGGGEAQPGEVTDRDVVKKLWGQLPERLRQQLLQSTADEFLPKYREELELYFRRLAEEQSNRDTTP